MLCQKWGIHLIPACKQPLWQREAYWLWQKWCNFLVTQSMSGRVCTWIDVLWPWWWCSPVVPLVPCHYGEGRCFSRTWLLAPIVKHVPSPIASQGQNNYWLRAKKWMKRKKWDNKGGSKAIEAADINGKKSKSGRVITGESELKERKITELLRLERDCWRLPWCLVWTNFPAQVGSPRTGCPGLFRVQMAF